MANLAEELGGEGVTVGAPEDLDRAAKMTQDKSRRLVLRHSDNLGRVLFR
jgi:hypothetical protein